MKADVVISVFLWRALNAWLQISNSVSVWISGVRWLNKAKQFFLKNMNLSVLFNLFKLLKMVVC